MRTRRARLSIVRLSIMPPALFAATIAEAYIGPGAGLSVVGSALALLGAVLLLIVGFVWYPIKRLLQRRKAAAELAQPVRSEADERTLQDWEAPVPDQDAGDTPSRS